MTGDTFFLINMKNKHMYSLILDGNKQKITKTLSMLSST